jgi:hypothetical protein
MAPSPASLAPAVTTQITDAAPYIRSALHYHEVNADPKVAYRLSYARIGNSGPSVGFCQADLHTNPAALTMVGQIMQNAKVPPFARGRILGLLREACPNGSPLTPADSELVEAALDSTQGRAAIDKFDDDVFHTALRGTYNCLMTAMTAGRSVATEALIGMTLWINQSGAPTTLLHWLTGEKIYLGGVGLQLGFAQAVDQAAWVEYYATIPFVEEHPTQMTRMTESIAYGLAHPASA